MSTSHWKRRRKSDRGTDESHVDDWLMTYADMITLLLCFFAVFIAIAIPDQVKFEEAKKKVSEQFSGNSSDYLKGLHPLPPTQLDTPPSSEMPYKALPSIVDRYNGNENIEIEKGDRITTIEMNSAPFFEKGSATLSKEGELVLAELQTSLMSSEYRDYTISIEGYTDDSPIKTPQFPSNWELSTARAAAVVRAFVELGVPAERLRAVGFAETSPKLPNRDADGKAIPENQAQNRRVVIRLEKITKQKQD